MAERINKVQQMKEAVTELLHKLLIDHKAVSDLDYVNPDGVYVKEAINIAVCYVITFMIEHAPNLQYTTYEVASDNRILRSEIEDELQKIKSIDSAEKEALDRALRHCHINRAISDMQMKTLGIDVKEEERKTYGNRDHLINMICAKARCYGYLGLYDMLFNRKDVLKIRGNSQGLLEKYSAYNDFIKHIRCPETQKDAKWFVLWILLFIKLETLYPFSLVAKLANYFYKNNLDVPKEMPEELRNYIAGVAAREYNDVVSNIPLNGQSLNGIFIDKFISELFPISSTEERDKEAIRFCIIKNLANITILLFCGQNKEKLFQELDDDFFVDASDFLKNEYKVADYCSYLPEIQDKKHEKIFRKIFLESDLFDLEYLEYLREQIKQIKEG